MADSIITEIKVYDEEELGEPDDSTDEGEPIPYVIDFTERFTEREYESFMSDGYIGFTKAELVELRDKITEALA